MAILWVVKSLRQVLFPKFLNSPLLRVINDYSAVFGDFVKLMCRGIL